MNKVKGESILLQFDFNCNLGSVEKGKTLSYTMNSVSDSKDDQFTVSKVDSRKHLLYTHIPSGVNINVGAEFTLFSSDRNHCVIPVVSIAGGKAALNTRKCSFEYEIREGLKLEARSGITKRPGTPGAASNLDSMYFLFGAGYPKISYSNALDKSTTDALKADSSISHTSFSLDLLGVYFPIYNGRMLCGGLAHVVRDAYSGESTKFEIYQIQAGISFLFFFNKQRFGKGFVLRTDVGAARYTATAVTDTTEGGLANTPAKNGYGAMAGGGWSFNLTESTLMLAQLLYAYRSMGDSNIATLTASLGLLF